METKPTIYPVVRWGVSQSSTGDVGLLRFAHRTAPGQQDSEAVDSPIYAMTPGQLRGVAETLFKLADDMEQKGEDISWAAF